MIQLIVQKIWRQPPLGLQIYVIQRRVSAPYGSGGTASIVGTVWTDGANVGVCVMMNENGLDGLAVASPSRPRRRGANTIPSSSTMATGRHSGGSRIMLGTGHWIDRETTLVPHSHVYVWVH